MSVAIILLMLAALLTAFHFYQARNYLESNEPAYAGNFSMENIEPVETLTVVSYNISYGKKIDQALAEIRAFQTQSAVDILLLQEMEERGVECIARELQLNYVYYPATVEPKYKRNFGNAVLSRWPIVDSQKLILPHISLSDRMKRAATRAKIRIQDVDVLAYSIHTEPVFILPKHKEEQCFAVLDDVSVNDEFSIAGGDFNAFTERYAKKLEQRFRQSGFVRASQGSGYTFVRFGIKMAPDQIFAKGFVPETGGILAKARASDHLPLWTILRFNNQKGLPGKPHNQEEG